MAAIESRVNLAQHIQKEFGVPASVQIAQAVYESGWWESALFKGTGNSFGVKCFKKNCAAGSCATFSDDTPRDRFVKYSSEVGSWFHYARVVTGKRYAHLQRHGSDYRLWCRGLQDAGYATDKKYAERLIVLIEQHKLWKYDKQ